MRNALRQPTVSTIVPPTIGPSTVSADVEAAHMPKARPRSAPEKACVINDSDPGTSSAPAPPCIRRKMTSHSSVGARPQSADVTPKPARPMAKTRRRP